ncbi:NADH-quinone oxidoreductase subunit C [Candidatus Parabeggiatoa sp. HSG14]|uniref:NADH-quinone oxidoreductase subunit C n=1 Tax=Candidatus Parabeggiatoa sp. HSG14 TaxID=3055593 RepID=UPI0025A70F09|nr:NADH-quinone oxidoreductase subunit C [Thiotrichales bacterium HSG14]
MNKQLPDVLESVFQKMPHIVFEQQNPRRLRVKIRADALSTLLELLKGRAGYLHLSAISCVEWPESDEFELVYHLWSYEVKTLVSVHIYIPKKPGRYVSVYDIYTPAAFFERDIHEMFGIYFEGSPNMEPFILTEWYGPPPMLKSFSTLGYVKETFEWQDYSPQWLQEIQASGGGIVE